MDNYNTTKWYTRKYYYLHKKVHDIIMHFFYA